MIQILGHWEIGHMTPIIEARQWNLVLRDFQVKGWNMIPVSGIRHNETKNVDLIEHHTYEEALEKIDNNLTRVFIEPRTDHQNPNTTWLHEFEHPKDCVYVFGSAHYNPTLKHRDPLVVSIKTKEDKGVLWANQCLTLVLYDRMVKENNK